MKEKYIWEIKVKNPPAIKRKCNHCSGKRFYSSDKFRMNSQKKSTDVWLIYRCSECDRTYNLTLLSRVKPEQVKKDLFLKFSANSQDLAWEYAFSSETARKNGVEFDYGSVDYDILHDPVSIQDILSSDNEIITFEIKTTFELGLKLSSVIRSCLGLSASQLHRITEAKAIFTSRDCPLKKQKVRDGERVLISKKKLQTIYQDGRVL